MNQEKGMVIERGVPLTLAVIGASGDLARKKIFPALFALYCQKFLPDLFTVMGFARTPMSDEAFRAMIAERLTCRYTPGDSCPQRMAEFLSRCSYVPGQYSSKDSFLELYARMRAEEGAGRANRVFYMAIPPSVFLDVSRALGDAGLISCDDGAGWCRAVAEKPFGQDRASSDLLVKSMGDLFREDQIYRIDHYLGKEVIQNLLVLRFANTIFDPVWNRDHVASVQIVWKEDFGIEDRGGYFDSCGIVRDVVQNHLLQILALVAMEAPASLDAQAVRDEKVRVLKSIPPVAREDIVIGQYAEGTVNWVTHPAYRKEKGVPEDSNAATYAAAVVHIENERWRGVPFLIQAGKALDARMTEIRIRFRGVTPNIFAADGRGLPPNELVIQVQPDEEIDFRILNKVPGLGLKLAESKLDLRYASTFHTEIPDAYECLILDVLRGDKSLFIRDDELAAAWDIFTPVLHQLDKEMKPPEPYAFGSKGPAAAEALAARYGVQWHQD